jgi:hypothetical protein
MLNKFAYFTSIFNMQRILFWVLLLIFPGCGTSYHYYSPAINTYIPSNQKEGYFEESAGTNGINFSGGYAFSNASSFRMRLVNSRIRDYRGKEFEICMNNKLSENDSISFIPQISFGTGIGNNYEKFDSEILKNFRGSFFRPFMMLTFGTSNKKPVFGSNGYIDYSWSLKANYFMYRGFRATTTNNTPEEKTFNSNTFFIQPAFNLAAGIKQMRISCGISFALKEKYKIDKNVSVFPMEMNGGICFFIGRKNE